MACFIVPAVEAVITTVAEKVAKSKETPETLDVVQEDGTVETVTRIPFSRKLGWLNKLLWGGVILLAFEHLWHGEVVPWFPFLTAMSDPADASEMFHEMMTVGTSMAGLITLVWGIMLIVSHAMEKKALREFKIAKEVSKA